MAAVLTSVLGEGSREVAAARSRAQAGEIIEPAIEYARRLMAGGPAAAARPGAGPAGPRSR